MQILSFQRLLSRCQDLGSERSHCSQHWSLRPLFRKVGVCSLLVQGCNSSVFSKVHGERVEKRRASLGVRVGVGPLLQKKRH